ncbi:ISEch8 OrfB [Dickeya dadantii 3937]|uniref:ISEch8 OrfB n=1 Tax=Dickeya dadantii (strain 3937) TaxID=198628 RepID=E0SJM7_DICD3|nr:ISEch8 OrfB [Dickeya dadantii 3937]
MSIRQACRTLSLSRTVYFYQPDTQRDEPVIQALTDMAERYPRYGFKKLFKKLRRKGLHCATIVFIWWSLWWS